MDLALDVTWALWRGVRALVWAVLLPARVLMFVVTLITYLMVTALVAGLLYGLWTSGARPW